jgi:hypothetical protein
MNHYSRAERRRMEVDTLLASDPIHWRTYEQVIET